MKNNSKLQINKDKNKKHNQKNKLKQGNIDLLVVDTYDFNNDPILQI